MSFVLVLLAALVLVGSFPGRAAVTITVPASATPVADADLEGNPATGAWSDALSVTIPLENGAPAPYGSAVLYAKHDGVFAYFRIDGKIDVPWISATGNHFWLAIQISTSAGSHHGGGTWDGTFFGLWDGTDYVPQPSYPPQPVDTTGFTRPPSKDASQDAVGRMAYTGSAAPYAFTAEWKKRLNTGDASDIAYAADGATAYSFFVTTDSNGRGSLGGSIDHSVVTNDNVLRFAAPPVQDTTPPSVAVSSPVDGSYVNGVVTIVASASDNVGVARVEFYLDGSLLGTDTTAPYSQPWDTSAAAEGLRGIVAKAFDAAGNVGTAAIAVTVDRSGPTVGITSPLDGATVNGAITIVGAATDPARVARVEFYVDASLLGTDASAPYEQAWDTTTAPDGVHGIQARAFDTLGNAGSASVGVTVANAVPIQVTIAAPWTQLYAGQTMDLRVAAVAGGSPLGAAGVSTSVSAGCSLAAASGTTDSAGVWTTTVRALSGSEGTTCTVSSTVSKASYVSGSSQLVVAVVVEPLALTASATSIRSEMMSYETAIIDVGLQGAGGEPVEGALVTMSSSGGGNVSAAQELGGGRYQIRWDAPRLTIQAYIALSLRARVGGYTDQTARIVILVDPNKTNPTDPTPWFLLTLPERLELRPGESVNITVYAYVVEGYVVSGGALVATVSSTLGTVTRPVDRLNGVYTFTFTASALIQDTAVLINLVITKYGYQRATSRVGLLVTH